MEMGDTRGMGDVRAAHNGSQTGLGLIDRERLRDIQRGMEMNRNGYTVSFFMGEKIHMREISVES